MSFKSFIAAVMAAAVLGGGPAYVIDPGHGGDDGGAMGPDGTLESVLNLSIAMKLDAVMGLFGAQTVLTRDSECILYPPQADTIKKRKNADQKQRVEVVASTENAVLVSIHQNNYTGSKPNGAQVFYNKHTASREFAEYTQILLLCLNESNTRTASAIPDEIYLMRMAKCPAILVECGFLSNPDELKKLKDEEYQKKIAVVLAAACVGFKSELEAAYGT